jgi:hypothetical protein
VESGDIQLFEQSYKNQKVECPLAKGQRHKVFVPLCLCDSLTLAHLF